MTVRDTPDTSAHSQWIHSRPSYPRSVRPDRSSDSSEVVVAIDGLSKRFGAVTAVEDFSFTVERGDVPLRCSCVMLVLL